MRTKIYLHVLVGLMLSLAFIQDSVWAAEGVSGENATPVTDLSSGKSGVLALNKSFMRVHNSGFAAFKIFTKPKENQALVVTVVASCKTGKGVYYTNNTSYYLPSDELDQNVYQEAASSMRELKSDVAAKYSDVDHRDVSEAKLKKYVMNSCASDKNYPRAFEITVAKIGEGTELLTLMLQGLELSKKDTSGGYFIRGGVSKTSKNGEIFFPLKSSINIKADCKRGMFHQTLVLNYDEDGMIQDSYIDQDAGHMMKPSTQTVGKAMLDTLCYLATQ